MARDKILVIDFSGHNNQLLARRIRDNGVYSEIAPYDADVDKVKKTGAKGIILIGEADNMIVSPISEQMFELGVPVLGVGYGAKLICEHYKTKQAKAIALLDGGKVTFLDGDSNTIYNDGDNTVNDFVFKTCRAEKSWNMDAFLDSEIKDLREKVGNKKILCALSGGVDSAVCATLIHKACPDNLICVFVDTGLMRKHEAEEVMKVFKGDFGMNVIKVEAEDRFLAKLKGVSDPEQKRKIIGKEFINVFEEIAKQIGAVDFLVQGTIYPDIIESGYGGKNVVKSHHNVGGLPSVIDFKEIVEPVRDLFKDEVRRVGKALGLPEEQVMRQPFPGPGLGVRCLGEVSKEKLEVLRDADFIFRDELRLSGLSSSIWQYFAIIANEKSTGVCDGKRLYGYTVILRAINTVDAMTAEWVKIPYDVLEKASKRIVTEIPCINRVVYDITSKPPATIEWE